ncbi:hypothetical protein V6N12_013111 [Hibiscus sabdariffa]|uniref:DUF4283 domain-containing protein n=1 Tax=Hibiscus sabdariffa TaxID=183260 RepID=A0ABR2EGR6_9ROSI
MNPDFPAELPAGSGEPHNHNKKCRQDEDPPDSGGRPSPKTTAIPAQPSSYKDTVLGDRQHENPSDEVFLDEEDIDLTEDDVIRSIDDGVITIDFSEIVHNLAIKSLEQTIVIKILRRIGYATLRNKLYEVWKPAQAFKLMDFENDYFLVIFRSRADYLHVLVDGPWAVFGHYVSVEPWTEDFSTTQPFPSNIVAWIHLSGLPVTHYKRILITELVECIGRVLELDYQTETRRRGRFARMAIRVNLKKPLVSKIEVNGRIRLVEYESLPTISFHCGKYGHVTDNCPDLQHNPATEAPSQSSAPMSEPLTTMFGSWMPPTVKQSTVPKRRSQPKTATSKQSSIALRIKYKPSPFAQHSVAFNVRKPLQLSLADLPILHRAGYKVGSSNHSSSSKDVYSLDKSRHSSVTLPENSDPNIQLPVPSQQVSNLVVEPPKKPLDPTGTVNTTVHTQETRPVDGHNAALSIDVPALISDAYDSAMLE